MDLGINGRWALVCSASKGLGLGCARALVREGVNVVIVARGEAALKVAADELRALPGAGEVRAVAADVTTEAGRTAALAPARRWTSWSTMPVVRRPVISAISNATTGLPRWTPTCWRRSR